MAHYTGILPLLGDDKEIPRAPRSNSFFLRLHSYYTICNSFAALICVLSVLLSAFEEFHPPASQQLDNVVRYLVSAELLSVSSIAMGLMLSFGFEGCSYPSPLDRILAWVPLILLDCSIGFFTYGCVVVHRALFTGVNYKFALVGRLPGPYAYLKFAVYLLVCGKIARTQAQ